MNDMAITLSLMAEIRSEFEENIKELRKMIKDLDKQIDMLNEDVLYLGKRLTLAEKELV